MEAVMEEAPTKTRTSAVKAQCPHCRREITVRKDGTLRRHVVPTKDENALHADFCDGSGIRPVVARRPLVARSWEQIPEFTITPSSRTYVIRIGDRCKVAGLGRGGAAGSGWKVTAVERHGETRKINVTVLHTSGKSRIVESGRIVYVRPAKKSGPGQ